MKSENFGELKARIYNSDRDGKTHIEHVTQMLQNLLYHKDIPFKVVLMESWYATNKLILYIDDLGKYYYCPLKRNFESLDEVEEALIKRCRRIIDQPDFVRGLTNFSWWYELAA